MMPRIDFDTMRSNCIQIHQECYEMQLVCESIGIPILTINKDELAKHEKTKSWGGMGRYAKELYDDKALWAQLPNVRNISPMGYSKKWNKEEVRASLLDCYEELGGNLLNAKL